MRIKRGAGQMVSRFLAKRPKLLFSIQERGLRAAYTALDLKMATWVVRRPEWLLRKSAAPAALVDAESIHGPAPLDLGLDLARRTIEAYRPLSGRTGDGLVDETSIWGELLQTYFGKQIALLDSRDQAGLAQFQAQVFHSPAVNGFSYGSTFDDWPHRWHYLPLHIELSVVQLAEAMGILRTECHEQGEIAFWRSQMSEEELMAALDEAVGFRIEQPRAGNPRGIVFGGRFLARETCSQIYTGWRIRKAIEAADLPDTIDIVEIGGGFGGTCYWLRQMLGDRMGRYAIVDLPEVSLIQASFLGQVDGAHLVLPGEHRADAGRTIELTPHTAIDELGFRPNVVLNQDSMPEMPAAEVARYLNWINRNLDGLFISFNQETLSSGGGETQVHVPTLAGREPRLRRVSRELSWDRRGYVEEVYSTAGL